MLPGLRDAGLLTVTALTALPLDPARFPPGSMFRPLFDVVRATLESEPLIPAADGEPHPARDLALAADPGLAGLLSPDQLGPCWTRARRCSSPTRPSPPRPPRFSGATSATSWAAPS